MKPTVNQLEAALDSFEVNNISELDWLLSRYTKLFWEKAKVPVTITDKLYRRKETMVTLNKTINDHEVEVLFHINLGNAYDAMEMEEIYLDGELQDSEKLLQNNSKLYWKIEEACFELSQAMKEESNDYHE